MTAVDERARIREALAAVRHCATTMDEQAAGLLDALPTVKMDPDLRTSTAELSSSLKDVASRVTFELALLAPQAGAHESDVATVTQRLIDLDASMMEALAPVADLADRLESAAESDDAHEPAFVLVIDAAGALLQSLKKANAATAALQRA
ncbi:MAG: hypothetical protein U1F09_00800 [Steroidobacteraceae bacterium]